MLNFFLINDFAKNPPGLLAAELLILNIIYGDVLYVKLDLNLTNNIL